jgi:hypothetical protein
MLDEEPLAGPATLLAAWIYCTVTYGFVFGFFLGWIPVLIFALLVAVAMIYLWPLAAIAILCGCIQNNASRLSHDASTRATWKAAKTAVTNIAAIRILASRSLLAVAARLWMSAFGGKADIAI